MKKMEFVFQRKIYERMLQWKQDYIQMCNSMTAGLWQVKV